MYEDIDYKYFLLCVYKNVLFIITDSFIRTLKANSINAVCVFVSFISQCHCGNIE